MNDIVIRPFRPEEAEAVSALIRRVLLEVNIRDYAMEDLKQFVDFYSPQEVLSLSRRGHSYTILLDGEIAGCGSLCPHETEGESIVEAFYIRPDLEGRGIGRRLMAVLEADPLFAATRRTVISASITAHPFYQKLGYGYVGGVPVCEDNDHYWMEKMR